ncbi:unnamed protein product [Adineta ricciae]|uniref:Uncharacterized protein n=1 Tax=Adineta ricciae TaxID=249248 RepID=A0A815SYM0_ADIRI|nr:unnamed protein product [Adineta ricciae]CAF1496151.1 unnamed protein product [Adineta ricciae]
MEIAILLVLSAMLVQMGSLATDVSFENCENAFFDMSARAKETGCLEIGEQGARFCFLGEQVTKRSARSLCLNRKKRSDESENTDCQHSESPDGTLCVTPDFIYQLGEASAENCTKINNNKQKCVGHSVIITCNDSQWTITQVCNKGTKCQQRPKSNSNAFCAPKN